MSVFRTAVQNLEGKSAYILIGDSLVKVTTLNVTDDLVEVKLDAPISGINRIYVHIDNIVLADNAD